MLFRLIGYCLHVTNQVFSPFAWADSEGRQGVCTPSPGKSQVVIGFLINTGKETLYKQLYSWVQLRPEGVLTTLYEIR